jgi:hypothetical protein
MLKMIVAITCIAFSVCCRSPRTARNVDHLSLQTTPASSRIVEKDRINVGWFNAPFAHPDIKTGCCSHPLRRKQWQYISLTSERYIVGFSMVNVGYLSTFFLYSFDMRTRSFIEFSDVGPGGGKARIAANSLAGTSSYTAKNIFVSVEKHYSEGYYLATISCGDKKKNSIAGKVRINVSGDPMVNIREIAPGKLVYTHQSTVYRPEGCLVCNGDTIRFNPHTDFAGFDYTQGRHNYTTGWNWAAAGGYAADSTPVGVCFSTGTGVFYWVNGTIHRVKDIAFNYRNLDSLWRIASPDSVISLDFAPVGKRTGKINVLGLLRSDYYQPFGIFSGSIRPPGALPIRIGTLRGVTEEHFAKW